MKERPTGPLSAGERLSRIETEVAAMRSDVDALLAQLQAEEASA